MQDSGARSSARARPRKTTASEIAPGVYVGGWKDAVPFEGVRYSVLDESPDEPLPADENIPVYDSRADRPIVENLDRLADLVEAARKERRPVLLFCGHGIRRGPLAGAWYLRRHEGISLDEAYRQVRAARPSIEHAKEWIGDWKVLAADGPPPRSKTATH